MAQTVPAGPTSDGTACFGGANKSWHSLLRQGHQHLTKAMAKPVSTGPQAMAQPVSTGPTRHCPDCIRSGSKLTPPDRVANKCVPFSPMVVCGQPRSCGAVREVGVPTPKLWHSFFHNRATRVGTACIRRAIVFHCCVRRVSFVAFCCVFNLFDIRISHADHFSD